MSEAQFIGIFTGIAISMFILEVGMISICDYLKSIKRLLEKLTKQEKE